ncbi:hypothetical protein BJ508DRAFT_332401 [Ascobolus immersus RN42]|uniref:Uncharacterized protein n=1 Tax=Ascobolus immersus RN42 TaxID=1160509 RepID=A0A3N4HP94_ASCIM|nr:hypothetical protein BJ508DRAFT_332401 [Ascobolus immersus RN42]
MTGKRKRNGRGKGKGKGNKKAASKKTGSLSANSAMEDANRADMVASTDIAGGSDSLDDGAEVEEGGILGTEAGIRTGTGAEVQGCALLSSLHPTDEVKPVIDTDIGSGANSATNCDDNTNTNTCTEHDTPEQAQKQRDEEAELEQKMRQLREIVDLGMGWGRLERCRQDLLTEWVQKLSKEEFKQEMKLLEPMMRRLGKDLEHCRMLKESIREVQENNRKLEESIRKLKEI